MFRYIYSAGGYGRELARLVRLANPNDDIQFVDDAVSHNSISFDEALRRNSNSKMIIGFSNHSLRARKTELAIQSGFDIFSVVAATAIVGDNVELGSGTIINDFAIITADARIGESFQCNIYSYVAHDCIVGDYVTLAPRVSVNGRVTIESNVYIGTNATILPGAEDNPIVIGKGAVVGAHALVTKSVEPGSTVVGCPARPI